MRNIFDQYKHPENRLTHALATCLAEDARLLRMFIRKFGKTAAPLGARLVVSEQGLPGEREPSEDEAERRGLPDVCISDGESWSLLIESKIAAQATADQLRRHMRTVHRRTGGVPYLILITAVPVTIRLPKDVLTAGWSEIYTWLVEESVRCDWARRAAAYFAILEARMIEEDLLQEGALTVFTGFPFGTDQPYVYGQAKRVLGQAMEELRKRAALVKQLGMDPSRRGRPAITGMESESVWDFLPISLARGTKQFTRFPHLTLGVERTRVLAHLTVPNGISPELRRRVRAWSLEGFRALLLQVERNMRSLVRSAPGAVPMYVGVQRRYATQRSMPTIDAQIEFDLRVVAETRARSSRAPKLQPSLIEAAFAALQNRGPNFQMALGLALPYRSCAQVRDPKALDLIEGAWIACRPLLDAVVGGRER